MAHDDFYRLEVLLVKINHCNAELKEMKEFNCLLDDWLDSPHQQVPETFLNHPLDNI